MMLTLHVHDVESHLLHEKDIKRHLYTIPGGTHARGLALGTAWAEPGHKRMKIQAISF